MNNTEGLTSNVTLTPLGLITITATMKIASQSAVVPPNGATILLIICAIVGSAGVLSNVLAMVVVFAFTNIWKQPSFYLLVNQIAVDFAACLFASAQYYSILRGDPTMAVFGMKITNDALCRWWYSKALMWTLINSSSCNVVMVTAERYVKVFHPLGYRTYFTKVGKN